VISFITFRKSKNCFRCQGNTALKLNISAQILQCHGAGKRCAFVRLLDVLVNMASEMHVLFFIINDTIPKCWFFFFMRPRFASKIFCILLMIRKQMILHTLIMQSTVLFPNQCKCRSFPDSKHHMQFMIKLFPLLFQLWIICRRPFFPFWNILLSHLKKQMRPIFYNFFGGTGKDNHSPVLDNMLKDIEMELLDSFYSTMNKLVVKIKPLHNERNAIWKSMKHTNLA